MSEAAAPESISLWARGGSAETPYLHATAVAVDGRGALICGRAGAGKSGLALSLLALGAELIADDGVFLDTTTSPPHLQRPETAPDLIEARGVGLLRPGPILTCAPLHLLVDLDRPEPDRLPPRRMAATGAHHCPLILGAGNPSLAAAVLLMLRHGRAEP